MKARGGAVPQLTAEDCLLDGARIELGRRAKLTSDELARVVGVQCPGGDIEDARGYRWRVAELATVDLVNAGHDGEPPDGGWAAAYQRMLAEDQEAVAGGSRERAGRDAWIRKGWLPCTSVYPLYLVREGGAYRMWDGLHRLAGAFFHGCTTVAVILGTPR